MTDALWIDNLRKYLGRMADHLQENVVLANYTTAHVGGPADAFLPVNSLAELQQAAQAAWQAGVSFQLMGAGSNLLVADQGVRGLVLLNRARNIKIEAHGAAPTVWAESGTNLGTIARQAALRGFSGLEWAATIPGTLGGAVYGNAGAHGSDMQASLVLAEILHPDSGKQTWMVEKMEYQYRSSLIKRSRLPAVILAARLRLEPGDQDAILARMDEYAAQRRRTQPPGATMGSMFKNPHGDYAGRLIEAAGLKGLRAGGAEISTVHANFFINQGSASAADIDQLVQTAQKTVADRFGIELELEIERIGEWDH